MKETTCHNGSELRHISNDKGLRLNQLDGEYAVTMQEQDMVRGHNAQLLEHGNELKRELSALQMHSQLLSHQHKDLKTELEEFIQTEDMVRSGLDR